MFLFMNAEKPKTNGKFFYCPGEKIKQKKPSFTPGLLLLTTLFLLLLHVGGDFSGNAFGATASWAFVFFEELKAQISDCTEKEEENNNRLYHYLRENLINEKRRNVCQTGHICKLY